MGCDSSFMPLHSNQPNLHSKASNNIHERKMQEKEDFKN